MIAENKTTAWYREPLVWMLVSPLLLVIVVCSILLGFALSSPDDRVADDYYKHGKLINKHFAAEQLAKSMGLAAEITLDFASGEVFLSLFGEPVIGDSLLLSFSHPAQARRDFSLDLVKLHSNRYRGELPNPFAGRWYLSLAPQAPADDRRWRLKGEVELEAAESFRLE
ncbi:MAG: FixH family protein [Cellvibrionaceae bacterium]|nr:FixH family protein [Cellvibrionaceae bacterium]